MRVTGAFFGILLPAVCTLRLALRRSGAGAAGFLNVGSKPAKKSISINTLANARDKVWHGRRGESLPHGWGLPLIAGP
jgi:hypothetical protein